MKNDGKFTILVADDDRFALNSLAELLEKEGYTVLRAENGAEAIEVLSRTRPNLVLTDLRMRGVDGMKVLQAAQSVYKHIPVIIMTGFASKETVVEAIRGGAIDYLSKPFKLDQVRRAVRRALDQPI